MKHTKQDEYLAPEFKVLDVEIEQGFAASNLEDPKENPEMDW
jgi:hypothetical protein